MLDLFKKAIPLKSQSILINTTKHTKVYHEHTNTKLITKFLYNEIKTGQTVITYLKQLRHPNILHIHKSKELKNNTYIKTVPLYHIKDFLSVSLSYQHYVISILADIIAFLEKFKICHNGIEMENFYCNENGCFVLAGFERASKDDNQNDKYMFFEFIKSVGIDIRKLKEEGVKPHKFKVPPYQKEPDPKETKNDNIDIDFSTFTGTEEIFNILKTSQYDNIEEFIHINQEAKNNNIYIKLEYSFLKFILMSVNTKIKLIEFIIKNSHEWIEIVKKQIIKMFIPEISNKHQKFKMKILIMVFSINIDDISTFIESLFSQPDSQVRLFLLHNLEFYIEKVKNWNKLIFENLLVGLKCNDTSLQLESIKFINKIVDKLDQISIKTTINALEYGSANGDIIDEGIKFINSVTSKIKESQSLKSALYKTIFIFLNNEEKRRDVLCLLKRTYDCFECRRLHSQILPLLCNYLSDETNQDLCFELTEEILKFLKENKSKIIKNEWGIKKIGDAISKVSLKIPSFISKSSNKSNDEKEKSWVEENDWNDNF